MPDGRTHHEIWKVGWIGAAPAALAVGAGAYLYSGYIEDLFALGGGMLAGYLLGKYISPDLDLIGVTTDESRLMEDFKIVGVVVVMIYFPYAYLMRFVGLGKHGHRNFFSHFPFVSTAIRLLWLLILPLVLLYWLAGYTLGFYALQTLLGVFLGLGIADSYHAVADAFTSSIHKIFHVRQVSE
jgi:uncharacterized metal-binding protein